MDKSPSSPAPAVAWDARRHWRWSSRVFACWLSRGPWMNCSSLKPRLRKAFGPCHAIRLPDQAIEAFGRIDIVVNNAGIAPAGSFLTQEDQVWDDVMAINVKAPAVLTRAAGKHMIAQGSGKIINIASTSGILGKAILVAYSSSKGALLQFTKALAAEWAKKGVQVNAIAPGAFATDAQSAVLESPDMLKRRLGKIPVRRMGETGEIGALICYLASGHSDFVTGSVFVIDGGESCKL
jgi:2-deoxy-D-gluconate 3-dehydrogenase